MDHGSRSGAERSGQVHLEASSIAANDRRHSRSSGWARMDLERKLHLEVVEDRWRSRPWR